YAGSNCALADISAAWASEVRAPATHVTAVAPGPYPTDRAGRSTTRPPRHISDYDALFDPVRQRRQAASGRQPGDPARAARALLEVVDSDAPPLHLLLGSDALGLVRDKLARLQQEWSQWEPLARSTDSQATAPAA